MTHKNKVGQDFNVPAGIEPGYFHHKNQECNIHVWYLHEEYVMQGSVSGDTYIASDSPASAGGWK
jgi:hypothetical protein